MTSVHTLMLTIAGRLRSFTVRTDGAGIVNVRTSLKDGDRELWSRKKPAPNLDSIAGRVLAKFQRERTAK